MRSVLHDWVMELPLRVQGTLLTGVRGCDLTPKFPLDSTERQLVAALRFAVMHPADPREVDVPGAFFQSTVPIFKASALGHYPQHWVSHFLHCAEVVAYLHPESKVQREWWRVYSTLVHGLHLNIESKEAMIERLTEDRVKAGTVVS